MPGLGSFDFTQLKGNNHKSYSLDPYFHITSKRVIRFNKKTPSVPSKSYSQIRNNNNVLTHIPVKKNNSQPTWSLFTKVKKTAGCRSCGSR